MLSAKCLITACVLVHLFVVTPAPVSSGTVILTATSASLLLRPTASAGTAAGEQNVILICYTVTYTIDYMSIDKQSLLILSIII